jgi:hypothetical protein
MTVYDPAVVLVRVHIELWLPLRVDGEHDEVSPAGEDDVVSATAPVNPPVD